MYKKFWKRIVDFALALIAAMLLLPLHLLISFTIKLESKGPVIFRQKRVGINKRLFNILKYRTMRTDAPHDVPTHQLSDPEHFITKMGKVLRKMSLDELPQIINILIGQMAIVGPRPTLWNQDDFVVERD